MVNQDAFKAIGELLEIAGRFAANNPGITDATLDFVSKFSDMARVSIPGPTMEDALCYVKTGKIAAVIAYAKRVNLGCEEGKKRIALKTAQEAIENMATSLGLKTPGENIPPS
jgi:hypothetical protein